ncbi:DUF969 domain-containing protein [Dyella silvae]|uniref:DUF969 domain-containing protein n=1 Tax=Dyella silvae TaxID=2994424 RepID=UPI00226447BB|nr:DUF969 domain-containing protein [Dyella silvae]
MLLVLIGVPIVVIGFALRFNALLVVTVAGLATGLAAGLNLVDIISAFGKAVADNRYMGLIWLTLPVIALLERNGLKERARHLISRVHAATAGRVLMLYFVARQITAALGLTSLGGHAQMVRPLIAPMAEAAATNRHGELVESIRQQIRAHAAAVDNIAVFFGEDIFIAIQSILLIKGFLEQNGIIVAPLQVSVWAIPTAVAALLIHGARLALFDRRLKRDVAISRPGGGQ